MYTRLVLGAILFTNEDEKFGHMKVEPLAGMFSIALDSFSDSQNFFYAFMSLLVLH